VTQLKVLGGLRLEGSTFTRPLPLLLLSYLSLEGPQYRRHLAELFWPDGNRMKSLSMALTRLRQAVGEDLAADDKKAWTTIGSDTKVLLEALDKSDWTKANELYTGAFLEGTVLDEWSNELEEWVYTTREYLAERVQYALLNLAEGAAKKQDFKTVANLAERAYKLPGLAGTELAALKRLYPLLCAGSSLFAPDVRKELEAYGVAVQLTTEEARATFAPSRITHTATLPLRGTSFVGRDEELAELATLLSKPNVSLLTLLGPAGVGKTRLALQLAHEQQQLGAFKDGIYFVPLDALTEASLLPATLLSHFGITQQGKTEPLQQLREFIAEKKILLVLDNFEHLTQGSSLLSTLLQQCPNLSLLVTSRERLNLVEEHLFVLEGLPFASTATGDAKLSDAVQLFVERAKHVQPHFEIDQQLSEVLRICGLVKGLPLGIELAASWVRLMSCNEIATEIERGLELLSTSSKNVPERHRSLRAAFDYSWQRLTAKEQEVLRKLSVFVGGFRREAASELAGATIPVLASLVDKSLLKVLPDGRYDRHPLLYQFTKEKFIEQSDERLETQENQARYYLTFAHLADSKLQGREQVVWFGRLDEELENLREALNYLETKEDAAKALELAASLGYFWNIRGYYAEGVGHLKRLLDKTGGHSPAGARAFARAGDLLSKQGEHQSAQHCYEQSLKLAKATGDLLLQAEALLGLGNIARLNRGEFARAKLHYEAALELARTSGDKVREADALRSLGALSSERADYEHARTCYERAARLYEDHGNLHNRAKCLTNLATVMMYLGSVGKAHALSMEALGLFRAVGDRHGTGIALLNLGVSQEEANRRKGNDYYEESLRLFRSLGDKRMVSHLLNNLAGNFQKLAEPHRAKPLLEESLAIQRFIGDVSLIAHALYILGQVYHDMSDLEQARQTYNECVELCHKNDDNWTLMRVLEVSAKLHLQQQDYKRAEKELAEALALAEQAGDKKTLQKILETNEALKSATVESVGA
jgi:predicted ATPase